MLENEVKDTLPPFQIEMWTYRPDIGVSHGCSAALHQLSAISKSKSNIIMSVKIDRLFMQSNQSRYSLSIFYKLPVIDIEVDS